MDPVGLQCSRSDPTAHPDPVLGDELIADGSHDGGGHDESQVIDLLRMHQPVDSRIPGEDSGRSDQSDDGQARHVFCLAIAVGEPSRRWTPPQAECQPKWHGSQGISSVVQSVT